MARTIGGLLIFALAASATTSLGSLPRLAANACAVALTETSPEYLAAGDGFLRALTEFANTHGRRFRKDDGARLFLLELAECLPEDAREGAKEEINRAYILPSDGINAYRSPQATARILSAFRALVHAWNEARPEGQISLENLHRFDEASAALDAMDFARALQRRDGDREEEKFRANGGAWTVLVSAAKAAHFPYSVQSRQLFDRFWRALPESTDGTLRQKAREAIDGVRDEDLADVNRYRPPLLRSYDAWKALFAAFAFRGEPWDGAAAAVALTDIEAVKLLEPSASRFARVGGLTYMQRIVRTRRGSASPTEVRAFLLETAEKILPGEQLRALREALAKLRWSAMRRPPETETKATLAPDNAPPVASSPRKTPPSPTEGGTRTFAPVALVGNWENQTTFEAIRLLVEAWNRAFPDRKFDTDRIDSPKALFDAFTAMGVDVPDIDSSDKPPPRRRRTTTEATLAPTPTTEPTVPPVPTMEPTLPPAPTPEALPEPTPAPAVDPEPPAAVPTPTPTFAPIPSSTPPPPLDARAARVDRFRSPSGGLAYLRGLLRQMNKDFEKPYFMRDLLLEFTLDKLPSPHREAFHERLRRMPWAYDDTVRAFDIIEGRSAADRILTGLEWFTERWNELRGPSIGVALPVDALDTADGIYRSVLWWDIGALTPAVLALRLDSGFVAPPGSGPAFPPEPAPFRPRPSTPVVAAPAPPRPTPAPTPRPTPPPPTPPPPTPPPPAPTPRPTPPEERPLPKPAPTKTPKPAPPKAPRPKSAPVPKPSEPEASLDVPFSAERAVNPVAALKNADPEELLAAMPLFDALRARGRNETSANDLQTLVATYGRPSDVPRTAPFRAELLRVLSVIAPKKSDDVSELIRKGLKSPWEPIVLAAIEATETYLSGGTSSDRFQLQRLAKQSGAIGIAAKKTLGESP